MSGKKKQYQPQCREKVLNDQTRKFILDNIKNYGSMKLWTSLDEFSREKTDLTQFLVKVAFNQSKSIARVVQRHADSV